MRVWWILLLLAGCLWDREGAGGAAVVDLTLYQGPGVPLVAGSTVVTTRVAPVLAGRPGRLVARVGFVADAPPRDLVVRFTLDAHVYDAMITVPEDRSPVAAQVDFDAGDLAPGTAVSVEVLEASGAPRGDIAAGQRVPAYGSLPLDARAAPRFKVEIVPVETLDGSPTITQAQLDRWQQRLYAFLPVSAVDLSLGPSMTAPVRAENPNDWTTLLGLVAAHRAAEGGDPDVFTYAAIPYSSLSAIGGMAATLSADDPYWRVAAGEVTDPNSERESETVVHELGHSLGRSHAPCGNPGGPDYAYPYAGAYIGVAGLDLRDHTMVNPNAYYDFMSYCGPDFVSDYGFAALYESLTWLGARARPGGEPPVFVSDPRLGDLR